MQTGVKTFGDCSDTWKNVSISNIHTTSFSLRDHSESVLELRIFVLLESEQSLGIFLTTNGQAEVMFR